MADNLVCGETSESWIIDNDDEIDGFTKEIDFNHEINTNRSSIPMMDSLFCSLEEERIKEMIVKETQFLPGNDYVKRLCSRDLDFIVRNQALDWILKVCAHYNFGPSCIYLSMNYLDRFLTSYELPKDKAWAVQLLAVSCLSLAVKIEESDMPQIVDLQVGDPKYVFEAKTITRMELLVLNTLNWRLQSLTPFSFIDYFINKITNNHLLSQNFINRSSEFILNTIKDIEFLDIKPSEIAAAVAVYVSISGESKTEKAISSFLHVEKERVQKCMNLMRIRIEKKGLESPIGVLEVRCLSYQSEERTIESCLCTNSSQSSQEEEDNKKNKRRKTMRD